MSSEYRIVSSENSPLSRGDKQGCKGPLLRGDRQLRVQRNWQGCVDRALIHGSVHSRLHAPAVRTPRLEKQAVPFFLHFSPLKRGFTVAIALFIFLMVSPLLSPLQAQGETSYPELDQYLQTAIEQNPELQSMRAMTEADREKVRETGLLMDPEITVMYDFNPMMYNSQLGRFSVSAMQMFPWFGTLEARRDIQRTEVEVRRAQISSRQLDILRDLQLIWFEIADIRQQIRITEETLELVRDLEKLVEARYETGRAGQADILRIQMEEQRLNTGIENLQDRVNPLKAQFNELLNRDASADIKTTDQIELRKLIYSGDELRSLIKEQNPQFDGIAAERSGAEKERRLAELEGRPSFGIGLEVMGRDFGPMSMFPDSKESVIGMATVRMPLFRSRYDSQKRQADYRIQSLDLQLEQTENRLITELETAMEENRSSERSVHLLDEELVPRAEQALRILSEEYTVGRARFDELLQIQRELLDLELERIEAVVGQNRAVIRIESLIGRGQ
jgi:outer membrane protein, heavy metal efflux system